MFELNGIPTREVNGLPYSVHQVADEQWQIVIQNCARHPAGYTFEKMYSSLDQATTALLEWPE